MTQHSGLTADRWQRFTLPQQLLQIGNELLRSRADLDSERLVGLRAAYERALRLTDLTIQVQAQPSLRRELLRWRCLIAELYVCDQPDPQAHRLALRTLFQLNAETYAHIDLLAL